MTRTTTRSALLAAAGALVFPLAACGFGETAPAAATPSATAAAPSTPATPPPTGPFGAGCAALPPEGEGSLQGMSDDPFATAAHTGVLSGLAFTLNLSALVDSLNVTHDITVLAPADAAFGAVPRATLDPLLADTPRLTALVTRHVIPGRLAPAELAGTHTTLGGDTVTIEGSGESFTISADQTLLGAADASVICGNVQTANATVYVVDQVLAPPAG